MEEYIFIILAIVLSVLGAFNRNKNKKGTGIVAPNSEGVRKPNIFDHFLDESFFEEKPMDNPVYVNAPKPPPVPLAQKESPMRKSILRNHEAPVARVRERASMTTKVERIQKRTPIRKSKMTCDIMNGFTLKKAVVYSEILNRKY